MKCYFDTPGSICLARGKNTDGWTFDGGFSYPVHEVCINAANGDNLPANYAETEEQWVRYGLPFWRTKKEMERWIDDHFEKITVWRGK